MIQTTVIKRQGQAVLVQYVDDKGLVRRVTVPARTIRAGDMVEVVELQRGIPYGVPWSELLSIQVSPERLEQELQRVGIWTAADLLSNPNVAIGAIQAAIGVDLAALIRAAQEWAIRERRT